MTVGTIITEIGNAMTVVLPDMNVYIVAGLVIGLVMLVGTVIYKRLRR